MLRSLSRTASSLRSPTRISLRSSRAASTYLAPVATYKYKVHQSQRLWSSQQVSRFSTSTLLSKDVTVTFIEPDGNEIQATGEEGTNLMELAHENDVDLEGACEGACACSTCHVILDDNVFDSLPEPTDEENDMLDLAFGLTDTSRLGCQVLLTPDMEGMRIKLPSATRNFYVDGAKPSHH
ncbi:mitochondrial matrix iron-sulfur protein [Coemansia sp. RSA 2337]|nr:mitochondrial matrix iron-sulfur protein [Coemansia sp. S3946]KAJ2064040.1 mitochondrial matrix iron-sulfur protein [Coemansia sp. S155-1]KAJ2076758.1 mitochondrial matrix iron-sulfur protein [Coemansia sp. S100]KAJ2095147.1 mitochondrial matrix iron-sulfur protein [Coemansia sp. S142-1]KAJ2114370.1 mitochondrial matrix iron-sulfur protein [Coemansia sp. RSA 922]KAJ2460166.1 mitochondrial matrix iron-sulfur protein [Coemansia sp. RSA 2337]